ncbi:transposase, partial [bacterium]|nr:transposase [bacterium]
MAAATTSEFRKAGSAAASQPGGGSLPAVSYERHPGAATDPLPGTYRRREPEKRVLHTVVREHLETFLQEARDRGEEGYPYFIEGEFRRYLDCGILSRGFARVRCSACGHERLVGFSCKGRLCPSCVGRRMADTAAYLVDQLLPEAGYRQWVLTFPWTLRFRLAIDRKLFSAIISAFLRTLFAWQRRRGRALGIRDGQTGAISFVQRFGGALNLHPHVHSLVPDGLFVPGAEDQLTFVPLPDPTTEQVEELTLKIARRLTGVVERQCADAFETDAMLEKTAVSLQEALAAAVKAPVSPSQLGLPGQDPEPPAKPLCACVAGFSLHGAQAVSAGDREALERLCRYGLRPAFAQDRLSVLPDGRVAYRLRRPWPHPLGTSWLLLDPLDFLKRLAALIPAPYTHMIRYHG